MFANQVMRRRCAQLSTVALFAVLFTAALPAFADDSAALPALIEVLPALSDANRGTLVREGELILFHDNGVSPSFLPETRLTAAVARKMIAGELNIGIEGLFFTPAEELPASYSSMNPDDRELILYNILRSVSTLQGLEYYSASRDEMRLLFEESWVISDPKSKAALPDPLVNTVPAEEVIYVHQKDKSFGNNRQEMTFVAVEDALAIDILNLTPMRYKGLIRVVDPGDMQIHLIVVPTMEGLLVYGTMSGQTKDVKAFLDRARNSFTNRVIALSGWYKARLKEEF